ncbi:hypothetical protein [Streptomyces sp. LN704]|uniref:hypothetical protein n=1 Tax=unclassified Streptomyces TaxID=2593676 RepID=UPI0037116B3F
MTTRNIAVTATVAAAAALVATGVTYASAAAPEAAPAVQQVAPMGGDSGQSKGNEGGGGGGDRGGRRHYEGRIDFNERSYSAQSWGCITVVSGLGSRSFNVRNDSHKTVEVFRGATCDNGSPLATVGPWSTSNGVVPFRVHGGVKVRDGVVGSFRVVEDHHGGYGGGFGGGDRGGDGGGFGGDFGGGGRD